MSNVVIDPKQSRVIGSTGMSLSSYGKTFTTFFELRSDGLLITLRGDEQVAGTIDFGRGKRQIANLSDMVVGHLERASENPENYSRTVDTTPTATPMVPYGVPQAAYGPGCWFIEQRHWPNINNMTLVIK